MNTQALSSTHILWAFGIGAVFVFWPALAKYSQASGAWVNTIVIIGSAIGGVGLAYSSLRGQPVPTSNALLILLVAGILNGAAVYFYAMKVSDPQIPTAIFVMTVTIAMLVVAPMFDYVLNGNTLSIRQGAGLGMAILAIFLLAG